MFRNTRSVTVL